MELLAIVGILAVTTLGYIAVNRANKYKALWEQAQHEATTYKLAASKAQLLAHFHATTDR